MWKYFLAHYFKPFNMFSRAINISRLRSTPVLWHFQLFYNLYPMTGSALSMPLAYERLDYSSKHLFLYAKPCIFYLLDSKIRYISNLFNCKHPVAIWHKSWLCIEFCSQYGNWVLTLWGLLLGCKFASHIIGLLGLDIQIMA